MFLKSLILRGFKTFADKTVLEFDPSGITAIVGPNGCGKSNTVDAFRFVLGEGSQSELRTKSLTDVIFAGTQQRKQLSLAEVCLTLDNSDQSLPIDYSEVALRRRTFRDGTSEFLINNNSCRLKDIKDLVLDAGISEDSLSIIGQGKADSILSSQPEERRAVFEEVAGIRKYKQRKQEGEKKIILAEQNLLRISDLKNEIGENLNVLEEQSKAAQEYTELKTKLKELELAIAKKQTNQLYEKREGLRNHIDEFKKSEEERDKQSKILEAEKVALKQDIKNLEIELENAFQEQENLTEKIENERSNLIIEHQRTVFEEKNKLRDSNEAARFLVFEIKQINERRSGLEAKLTDLKNKSQKIKIEDLEILPELKDFLINSEKLISISKNLVKALHNKELDDSQMQNKLTEVINAEIKEIENQLRQQEEIQENKSVELMSVKRKVSEVEEHVKTLEKEGKDLNINLNKKPEFFKLQEEHSKLQEKISSIKHEKEDKSSKLEFLESHEADQEKETQQKEFFKNELQLAKIEGELSQIEERFQTEYNLTIEELLKVEHEVSSIAGAKRELNQTRSRMFELEPVNLLAIEEFKQAQERYKLINEQYDDLIAARENLRKLIDELDKKAKEEFVKKMDIIAGHFKEIFSHLFVGGEAKLELCFSGTDNPLEAGIEISTCPSGRKWLPLQALSGGERALTAIAILFAFLKTNPSPFCILDEVDAPLDDANIDRFTKYLKEISKVTQILIITHNKHTMKAADTLYGITMQEPGISKVLSMKMNKSKAPQVA